MKDQFYIVLPSNSSTDIFPDNTTTHFSTYLTQQVNLEGSWLVGLTEIQIPYTFQHFGADAKQRYLDLHTKTIETKCGYVSRGIYKSVESLVAEINTIKPHNEHIKFSITNGGYVTVNQICGCSLHSLSMAETLQTILGFNDQDIDLQIGSTISADKPANLCSVIPSMLMVYADILEYTPTGDVETQLLRSIPLSRDSYTYDSLIVKNFSPPMYVPLITKNFRTIEIDKRDQFGQVISFDSGTLTVTLHFKRSF